MLVTDGTMPTMWPLHTHLAMEFRTLHSNTQTSSSMEEILKLKSQIQAKCLERK